MDAYLRSHAGGLDIAAATTSPRRGITKEWKQVFGTLFTLRCPHPQL